MEKEDTTSSNVIKDKSDSFLRLSSSIACMRFPLAITIIFYHSHTIVSIPDCQSYFKFIYPFSLWLGETGVPAFFFISGLWFFYSKKTYMMGNTEIKTVTTFRGKRRIWLGKF